MKQVARSAALSALALAFAGCWIALPARDRPAMRAQIGHTGTLTSPTVVYRDRGGRLHLTTNETRDVIASSVVVERLPAGVLVTVKDVIARVIPSGRWHYYVIELASPTQRYTIEIPDEPNRPRWVGPE